MTASTSASSAGSAPAAPATGLLPLATLAIGFIMAMLDVTVVNVALPGIAAQFGVPLAGLVWIVDGYTLAFAALLLVAGALADRYGARRIYLTGLAVFTLASLLCGLAWNADVLIGARMVQGFGAALFMPSSLSLLAHTYEDDALRARMVSLWSAIVAVAAASGPLVGGMLIAQYGWRGVFLVNLPVGLAGLWLAATRIRPAARHPRPLSLGGHALGVAMLASACYALIEGNVHGWSSPPILASVAAALASGALLVARERRHPHPVLPRPLYATPGFGAVNGIGFLINFGSFGQLFLLSLYLQDTHGALATGMLLLPIVAVFSLGNLASGRVSARGNLPATLAGGLAVGAAANAMLAASGGHLPYALLAAGAALGNLGLGTAIPAMTALTMQLAGRAYANGAAAALNANRQAGALVGVAVMGTLIHGLADWPARLAAAFAISAAGYAGAAVLASRRLRRSA